jgi:hypothetical protein
MNLPELHDKALSIVSVFYIKHEGIPTMFFATDAENRLHLMPAPDYPGKRDFYQMVLRAYFVAHKITAYAFASEAWMAETAIKPGEEPPVEKTATGGLTMKEGHAPASERPDRIECVVSGAVDAECVRYTCNPIVREPGKRPRIGPPRDDSDKGPALIERVALFGLLDVVPDPAHLESVKRLMALIPMEQYFPGYKVLTPAEHDRIRN